MAELPTAGGPRVGATHHWFAGVVLLAAGFQAGFGAWAANAQGVTLARDILAASAFVSATLGLVLCVGNSRSP